MSDKKKYIDTSQKNSTNKQVVAKESYLYRIVMSAEHICPYGLKSLDLLKSKNYKVKDVHLTTKEEIDAFKKKHSVETTPQIFINGERIGGYDELKNFFRGKQENHFATYKPIINIFTLTLLMSLSFCWYTLGTFHIVKILEFFMAFSVCTLAALKLKDTEKFSTSFLSYDLLAQRFVKYGYVYPYAEAIAGIGMLSTGLLSLFAGYISLCIGFLGAISVIKAVYVEKRDIKCACVGGDSSVPLGFISLTENLMMFVMGSWMVVKYFI